MWEGIRSPPLVWIPFASQEFVFWFLWFPKLAQRFGNEMAGAFYATTWVNFLAEQQEWLGGSDWAIFLTPILEDWRMTLNDVLVSRPVGLWWPSIPEFEPDGI